MKDFFNSPVWNIIFLVILAFLSVFTGEIVTFAMLGIIMIMLTNIYNVLRDISKKLDS
ncbi:hypothetical protein [Syntrophomonas erecta]